MENHRVSITDEDEIWQPRREIFRAYQELLRTVVKEEGVDQFRGVLQSNTASLPHIFKMQGRSGISLFTSLVHVAASIEKADILQALIEEVLPVLPEPEIEEVDSLPVPPVLPEPENDRSSIYKNNRGDTPLHVAARTGRIDTANLLVGDGVSSSINVFISNDKGNTALHEAVKNGHLELTRLLLSRGSRAVYLENKETKCPLYLAVETGNLEILQLLMAAEDEYEVQGMSPVHGAVMHQRLDMMKEMSKQKKRLFKLRDARNGIPLHLAASVNYVDGVKFLVEQFGSSAFECDEEGYLPIHVACKMGHLETIKELLGIWPHPGELLTSEEGQNILHVAAKYGMVEAVKHILGEAEHGELILHVAPKCGIFNALKHILGEAEHGELINAKDKEGNTPLHVATLQWQPEVLLSLTRDKRVDLKLENNENSTALDIVDEKLKEADAPLHQSLTRMILVSAKVPRSKGRAIRVQEGLEPGREMKDLNLDRLKAAAETRMLVATLIATMTFAAGFSVPGGYNGSKPDAGIATLLDKPMYNVFVICNTVAMYSSIITVVILLWTQINDGRAVYRAITYARLPLLIALATMSMAFLAGST